MRSPLAKVRSWPAEFRARYRELGYWTDETFPDFIDDRCSKFAENLAVVGRDAHGEMREWNYAELYVRAVQVAKYFSAQGVEPGDRVVVSLPNTVEFIAIILGLFKLGAIPVFSLPAHRELELGQFCELSDAAALVIATGFERVDYTALYETVSRRLEDAGVVPPVLVDIATWDIDFASAAGETGCLDKTGAEPSIPPCKAEDIAFLQLSGGTTGVSKLIPRTHADYLYSVRASAEICELTERTKMLVVLPAAHNFAMSSPGILGILHSGGTIIFASDPSPATAFKLISQYGVTMTALVPPLAQAWISAAKKRQPDLSSLEIMQVGGAKLADTVAPDIQRVLGATLQQVFGMAEGLVNYTRFTDDFETVCSTQGLPISEHDEIKIVDAYDNEVPDGAEGSLLTRGPYTIRGYYKSPQADVDSFTSDGFYRTGDLVRKTPDGHLIVTGRDKDQINRGGEKIACDEVEALALAYPSVHDAVLIGMPDEYLGEKTVLVVRADDACEHAEILAHLRDSGLASYKIPDEIVFLDVLPVTAVGKNSRRELRRILATTLRGKETVDALEAEPANVRVQGTKEPAGDTTATIEKTTGKERG